MSVYSFFLAKEFVRKPAERLRQFAFLVPVVAIPLFLILLSYLPYANQWLVLSNMRYEYCEFADGVNASDDSFRYAKAMSFARKGNDGRVAVRGVDAYFTSVGSSVDYDHTPFSEAVTIRGKDASRLEAGEAIVSENVAQSLGISIGDTLLISGDDGLLSKANEYRLVGLTMTRYSYGDIGKRWGIALAVGSSGVNSPATTQLARFVRSNNEATGDVDKRVTLAQEKTEALSAFYQGGSYFILLLSMLLLMILVMSKEAAYRFESSRKDLALLVILGADRKVLSFWLAIEQLLVMLLSTAVSLFILKLALSWRVFELTFYVGTILLTFCLLALVEALLVFWFYSRRKMKIALDGMLLSYWVE